MSKQNLYWYNYKTGEYEKRDTPTDFADYIPQSPAAQSLYRLYIEMGDESIEAARKVLEACVKVTEKEVARQECDN